MTKAAATEGSSQIYSILFRAVPKRGMKRGGFGGALLAVLVTFVLGFLI